MESHHEIIAAFADGEPVDPQSLTQALAEADGREYLIDVLALRAMVGGQPGARPQLASGRPPRPRWRWLSAVAAVLVAGVLGGYAMGRRTNPPDAATPGTVLSTAGSSNGPVTSAPAPTRVIRLEPGVDWNERAGGD